MVMIKRKVRLVQPNPTLYSSSLKSVGANSFSWYSKMKHESEVVGSIVDGGYYQPEVIFTRQQQPRCCLHVGQHIWSFLYPSLTS